MSYMSEEEKKYVLRGGSSDELNPLLFKRRLTLEEKAALSDEELLLRKKFADKATRFRHQKKFPEKAKEKLEKLKLLKLRSPRRDPSHDKPVESVEEFEDMGQRPPVGIEPEVILPPIVVPKKLPKQKVAAEQPKVQTKKQKK